MKSDFHSRKARREQRLQELADKNKREAEELQKRSSDMASVIPFGQPILIGHHSEKRDRAYRNKIAATMDNSIRAQQKAEYFESRLESSQNNNSISSDDPEALKKLKEKLAALEILQARMKETNKIVRDKKLNDNEKVTKLIAYDKSLTERTARALLKKDFCGRTGYADYMLTNNNGNMRRIRLRIEELEKLNSLQSTEETIGSIRIVLSTEDNRVQIFFPEKPSEEIRKKCRDSGFHWSPTVGAWQRMLSNHAIYLARQIATTQDPGNSDCCDSCGA